MCMCVCARAHLKYCRGKVPSARPRRRFPPAGLARISSLKGPLRVIAAIDESLQAHSFSTPFRGGR